MELTQRFVISLLVVFSAFFIISCNDEVDVQTPGAVQDYNFDFSAVNESVMSDKEVKANGLSHNVTNITFSFLYLGEKFVLELRSNELPVTAGNEIVIMYTPKYENESSVIYLPDGKTFTPTIQNPSMRWIIPNDFKSGMKISGETKYKIDGTDYTSKGELTLVEMIN